MYVDATGITRSAILTGKAPIRYFYLASRVPDREPLNLHCSMIVTPGYTTSDYDASNKNFAAETLQRNNHPPR